MVRFFVSTGENDMLKKYGLLIALALRRLSGLARERCSPWGQGVARRRAPS